MSAEGFSRLVMSAIPLGYWKNTENSGGNLIDHSGNGFDGTWRGNPDYSRNTRNGMGELTPWLSGGVWVRLPGLFVAAKSGVSVLMIVRHERDLSAAIYQYLYLASFTHAGEADPVTIYAALNRFGSYKVDAIAGVGSFGGVAREFPRGTERLLVVTLKDGLLNLYVNGILVASAYGHISNDALRMYCSLFRDSVEATSVDTTLVGNASHVAIFNKQLSGSFVKELAMEYMSGISVSCSGIEVGSLSRINRFESINGVDPLSVKSIPTSGVGTISGHVSVLGKPVKRMVRLVHVPSGIVHQTVWSGADGGYKFEGVSALDPFCVMSHDHEGKYNAVVADNVYAELK